MLHCSHVRSDDEVVVISRDARPAVFRGDVAHGSHFSLQPAIFLHKRISCIAMERVERARACSRCDLSFGAHKRHQRDCAGSR